jgi:DNA-binding MarR family transcriptional regulator
MTNDEAYLRAILSVVARQAFPPNELANLVGQQKQRQAYNLCDGSRSQAEIGRELGLDKSAFSKTLSRWIDIGVALRVSDGNELRPVHLYPIPQAWLKDDKNG